MNDFVKLCPVKDLKEKEGRRFIVGDVEVALFKVNEKIYALSNICPHQHTALIYDGFLENGFIVCPVHGWMFNLETGRQKDGRKGLDSYEVKLIGDDVFVKVQDKKFKW